MKKLNKEFPVDTVVWNLAIVILGLAIVLIKEKVQ